MKLKIIITSAERDAIVTALYNWQNHECPFAEGCSSRLISRPLALRMLMDKHDSADDGPEVAILSREQNGQTTKRVR